jgi:hypothetical protein
MKKSISMFYDLIHQVNLGTKTQTIRLVKPILKHSLDFEKQFEIYTQNKTDSNYPPEIQLILDTANYTIGDKVVIENSKTSIEILSVELNRVFSISDNALGKEGIKSQSNPTIPNTLLYFDYLTENYNLVTIKQSYETLMVKCYGISILKNNPFVLVYGFNVIKQ